MIKVRIARKEYPCTYIHCSVHGRTIKKGEPYVSIMSFRKFESGNAYWHVNRMHPECWELNAYAKVDREVASIRNAVNEQRNKRRNRRQHNGARGRPRKWTDSNQALRLKALRHYYVKKRDSVKVEELDGQLEALKVGATT